MKPEDNLRRTDGVYAGWGFSQAFFWDRVYTDMGHSYRLGTDLAFPTLEDFLVQYWEGHFLDRRDVNDLLSMLWTWQYGDIGQTPGLDGDHVKALQSIKARLVAMPALKDLYFPPEDEEYASQYIPNGEVRLIPGVWGHFAGSGDCVVDRIGSTTSSENCSRAEEEGRPVRQVHGHRRHRSTPRSSQTRSRRTMPSIVSPDG